MYTSKIQLYFFSFAGEGTGYTQIYTKIFIATIDGGIIPF